MDSFELNKIAAAVLFSLLLILGVKNAAEIIYETHDANPKSFVVEGVIAPGESAPVAAAEPDVPLPVLLAKADVAAGEKQAKKCQACHNLQEGAGAKIGPDLYDVVGRKVGVAPGFAYSAGMEAHAAKAPVWTFEELFHFLENPRGYIDGTAMSFAGIKKPEQRADLLAYLNTLGSNLPLPKVEAAPAAPAAAEPAAAEPAEH
jgi:cytochrome c